MCNVIYLQLACVELLAEAFHQEDVSVVTSAGLTYLGVWVVMAINHVVP